MDKKITLGITGSLIISSLFIAGTAFAQTPSGMPSGNYQGHGDMRSGMNGNGQMAGHVPGVFGTVSSVNGDTIVVSSKAGGPNATTTATKTYTVDATNATVIKDNATSSVSAIASGDTVIVQGTVNGDTVTATMIRDGMNMVGMHGNRMGSTTGATSSRYGMGQDHPGQMPGTQAGFMGAISSFFHRIFSFL